MIDFLVVLIVGFVLGVVVMFLIGKSGHGASIQSKYLSLNIPSATAAKAESGQVEAAFERFTDVAQGVVAIMDAPPGRVAQASRQWFDFLASNLSGALRTQPDELYRVAIWEDTGDPGWFAGIGWAMFDANDAAVEKLRKDDSLAGIAFRSPTDVYYSPDVTKDPNYIAHSGRPRRYRSVFTIALGAPQPWGVMTVDAKAIDGFTEADQVVIRRFATLVSVGFAAREAWPQGTTVAPDPSIVGLLDNARTEEGGPG